MSQCRSAARSRENGKHKGSLSAEVQPEKRDRQKKKQEERTCESLEMVGKDLQPDAGNETPGAEVVLLVENTPVSEGLCGKLCARAPYSGF